MTVAVPAELVKAVDELKVPIVPVVKVTTVPATGRPADVRTIAETVTGELLDKVEDDSDSVIVPVVVEVLPPLVLLLAPVEPPPALQPATIAAAASKLKIVFSFTN